MRQQESERANEVSAVEPRMRARVRVCVCVHSLVRFRSCGSFGLGLPLGSARVRARGEGGGLRGTRARLQFGDITTIGRERARTRGEWPINITCNVVLVVHVTL